MTVTVTPKGASGAMRAGGGTVKVGKSGGVKIPIFWPVVSTNQRLPSGPATIPRGEAPRVGTTRGVWSTILRVMGSIAQMWANGCDPLTEEPSSVSHTLPSGPAVMPKGCLAMSDISTTSWVKGLITPTAWAPNSVNQTPPSGPAAIPIGCDAWVEMKKSAMTWVAGSIVPIRLADVSVNQRWPSGPAAIAKAPAFLVGMANSLMAWVIGSIAPIWLAVSSANQRRPSGPAAIPSRPALLVGTGNSVMTWVFGLIAAMRLAVVSVNQRRPSGPAAMKFGPELAVGVAKSRLELGNSGEIIPTLLARSSVNQRLPSGPATMEKGLELGVGTGSSWTVASSCRGSIGSTPGRRRRRAAAGLRRPPHGPKIEVLRGFGKRIMVVLLSVMGCRKVATRRAAPPGPGRAGDRRPRGTPRGGSWPSNDRGREG